MLRIVLREAKGPVVAVAMTAGWVYVELSLLAAMMFARESRAPLIITLLVATVASAIVAALVSASMAKADVGGITDRAVAASAFVNASAAFVGSVANLSSSIELQKPAGPNGLTWILEVFGSGDAELVPYCTILFICLLLSIPVLVEGSKALAGNGYRSEARIEVLWNCSYWLFALLVVCGTPWKEVPVGSKLIANFWIVVLFVFLSVFSLWAYSKALIAGIRSSALFYSSIGSGVAKLLSNWKTITFHIAGVLLVVPVAYVAALAFWWLNWLIVRLAEFLGAIPPETSNAILDTEQKFRSLYLNGVLWLFKMFGMVGVAVLGVWTTFILARLLARAAIRWDYDWQSLLQRMKPTLGGLLNEVLTLFRGLIGLLAKVEREFVVFFRVMFLIGFAYLMPPHTYKQSPGQPTFVVTQASDLRPIDSPVSVEAEHVEIEFGHVELCSEFFGTYSWMYESDDSFEINIHSCANLEEGIVDPDVVLLVALATLGYDQKTEEARSERRAQNLASWASRYFDDRTNIFVLNLGMVRSPQSGKLLEDLIGPTNVERPVGGVSVRPNGEGVTTDQLLGVLREKVLKLDLRSSFTSCDLLEYDRALRRTVLRESADFCGATAGD